jgi:eukaryotic-like serine/threonine-protein kinase
MEGQVQRQLLIAMLAIQGGWVSNEQLLDAFAKWESDRTRTLEDILYEQGALTDVQRIELIAQLDRKLSDHEHDPATCLKTLVLDESFDRTIREVGDQQLYATLLSSLTGNKEARRTSDGERENNETHRFLVLKPHARGGLGIVSIAYDRQLNRQVALKEIRIERAMDVNSQIRFVQEAEITGQLEHPGIVPVYGLGTYKDGRPFYAMRFVEGQNFKVAIREFHQGREINEPLDGDRGLTFRKLLGRLLHVCQAIEYAHSRNVLHRDLKPDNILLGPYGETLVVDWGLAKATLDENSDVHVIEAPPKKVHRPVLISSGSSSDTVEGSALGTPAYMSPEQASGRVNGIGPATDVYSLGATLFSLLTGAAPVTGKNSHEMVEKARLGDCGKVRDYWKKAPGPLVSICNKAMAHDPMKRYPSARALADDIERWLADAPVSAHSENLIEKASRFVRKHQTFSVSTAIVLLAMLGFGFVATWFQARLTIKDLESKSLQLHAQEQELFAEVNAASQRAAKRQPGWTWINETALVESSKKSTNDQSAKVLREEIARTMISADVRRVRTIVDDLTISCMAFSNDGKVIALGENTATFLQVHVRLIDAESLQTIKTLTFSPSLAHALKKIETDGVSSLSFSPDNRTLYVGSRGGEILQFDLSNHQMVTRWEVHQSRVDDMGLSDDGQTLVSISRDGTMKWWNVAERKLLKSIDSRSYRRIVKTDDGFLAAIDGLRKYSWRSDSLEPPKKLIDINSDIVAAGPGLIASSSSDEIDLYNSEGLPLRKLRPNPPMDNLDSVSIGYQGKYLVAQNGRSFDLWESVSGNKIATISGVEIACCKVDPLRPRIWIAGGKILDLYEIRDDACWSTLPNHKANITSVKVSGNGEILTTVCVGQSNSPASQLQQFQVSPLQPIGTHDLAIDLDSAWTVNKDGSCVTHVDSESKKLVEFDLQQKTDLEWMSLGLDASNVQYAADGKSVWTTYRPRRAESSMEKLESWRVAMTDRASSKALYEWNNQIQQLTKRYSDFPDLIVGEKYVVTATRQTIMLWNLDDSDLFSEIPITNSIISQIAFADDESKLVVGDRKGQLFWIDLSQRLDSTSKPMAIEGQSGAITALATVGDGQFILVGDLTGEIAIWRFRSNEARLIAKLGPFFNAIESIHALASGQRVALHLRHESSVRILDIAQIFERWKSLKLLPDETARLITTGR